LSKSEDQSVVDDVFQALKSKKALGLDDVVKCKSPEDLQRALTSYEHSRTISPSFPPSMFFIAQHDEKNNSLSYERIYSDGPSLLQQQVDDALNLVLVEQFDIEGEFQISGKVQQVDFTAFYLDLLDLDLVQILYSFIPLLLISSKRLMDERGQGVTALLLQWGVSNVAYIVTHFVAMLEVGLLSCGLGSAAYYVLRGELPLSETISTLNMFRLTTWLTGAFISRGLFVSQLANGTFGNVLLVLATIIEIFVGNVLFVIGFDREYMKYLLVLLPGFVTANMRPVLRGSTTTKLLKDSNFELYMALSIANYLFLALTYKTARSMVASFSMSALLAKRPSGVHCNEDQIAIENVSKRYKQKVVLSNFHMKAEIGKVHVLLGRNGAGKSTLMNMITGCLSPSSGSINLFGLDPFRSSAKAKQITAYCAQENQYWEDLTLGEHFEFFSALCGKDRTTVSETLDEVGLKDSQFILAKDLSGGMKRRLNLVLCDIRSCSLIVLDEPTSGVDQVTQRKIWKFIEKLKKKAVVILATHYMEEAQILADRVYFLQGGRLVLESCPKQLQQQHGSTLRLVLSVEPSSEETLIKAIETYIPNTPVEVLSPGSVKIYATAQGANNIDSLLDSVSHLPGFTWVIKNNVIDKLFNELCPVPNSESYPPEHAAHRLGSSTPCAGLEFPSKDSKEHLFANQVRITLWKNFMLHIRNVKMTASMLIFFGIIVYMLSFSESQRPTIPSWETSFGNLTYASFSTSNTFDRTLLLIEENSGADITLVEKMGAKVQTLSKQEYLHPKLEKTSCTFKIEEATKDQLKFVHLVDDSRWSSQCVPSLLNNYRLQVLNSTSQENHSFTTVFGMSNMDPTFDMDRFVLRIFAVYLGFCFFIIIVLFSGRFILYEKKRDLDKFLRLQGIQSTAFWIGTVLFHMLIIIVLMVTLALICGFTKSQDIFCDADLFGLALAFFSLAMFLLGFVYLFTSFLRTESYYIGMCLLALRVSSYISTDREPLLYISPPALYSKAFLSATLGMSSLRNTWIPSLCLLLWGIFLVAVTCVIEEKRKGGFHSKANPNGFDEDLEKVAPTQVDQSTTEEMRAVRLGEKSVKNQAIVVNNVTKTFNHTNAISDVFLGVSASECFGLLGPNGSGKTTLINMILGLVHPTKGSIQTLVTQGNEERVGFCPQFGIFYDELTVLEHLEMSAAICGISWKEKKSWAMTVAQFIGLESGNDLSKRPKELSGGMRRRLSFGLAIMGHPRLLILDEPTTGVDPVNREIMWRLIQQYQKSSRDFPISILLTSHHLEEIDILCDRVGILKESRMQCIAPQAQLKKTYSEGYCLSVMIPLTCSLDSNQEVKETEALDSLDQALKKALGMAMASPLYNQRTLSRRREVVRKDNTTPSSTLCWDLQAVFTIPYDKLNGGNYVKAVAKVIETNSILEWQFGLAELEDVFINVICSSP
jgi:ABC-type multidrug transport system ATPase subunit/uncharacterized Tic20 family protein